MNFLDEVIPAINEHVDTLKEARHRATMKRVIEALGPTILGEDNYSMLLLKFDDNNTSNEDYDPDDSYWMDIEYP